MLAGVGIMLRVDKFAPGKRARVEVFDCLPSSVVALPVGHSNELAAAPCRVAGAECKGLSVIPAFKRAFVGFAAWPPRLEAFAARINDQPERGGLH